MADHPLRAVKQADGSFHMVPADHVLFEHAINQSESMEVVVGLLIAHVDLLTDLVLALANGTLTPAQKQTVATLQAGLQPTLALTLADAANSGLYTKLVNEKKAMLPAMKNANDSL